MVGLYEQTFGNCAMCGFNAIIVGGLEPCTMIGHDPASNGTAPTLVSRFRCMDHKGCERRRQDYGERAWIDG